MSVTTIRLKPEIEQDLDAIAARQHRTRNWLVNQALQEYIQRQQQEQLRWQETLAAMESVAQGKVASGEAVHGWLRSWGTAEELPAPKIGK